MSDLIPAEGDNLKLLNKRFSSIKKYIEDYYSSGTTHVIRDTEDRIMVVLHEPRLDTHMHRGWYESHIYIPPWRLHEYNNREA